MKEPVSFDGSGVDKNKPLDLDPGKYVDPGKYDRYMLGLRDQQNLVAGLLGGAIAALAGSALWATVTYLSGYQLGLMAIVAGALVGQVVQKAGKGVDIQFRILGALLALLSCLVGNVLVACIFYARQEGLSILSVVSQLRLGNTIELVKLTFEGMDLLFYGIAVYEGFRFSVRKLTQADYLKISQMP